MTEHNLEALAHIGAALMRALDADPLLITRLPRRVVDAIDLAEAHDRSDRIGVAS